MISVKKLSDIQIVLRNHDTKLNALLANNQDFHGRRILNAGNAKLQSDYVTLQQLPTLVEQALPATDQNLAIVFSFGNVMPEGSIISAGYNPGEFRTGIPQWVRLSAQIAPSGGNLNCNVSWRRSGGTSVNILTQDISLLAGNTEPVKSIMFINPVPFFDANDTILPICDSANGAGFVTITIGITRKLIS